MATRPTTDRVRESLFNILLARGDVPERVLDLYAGSGALGFEALSRGAKKVVFVDDKASACDSIRDNARTLGVEAACDVSRSRVHAWLSHATLEPFGWIFLDPPYAAEELDGALALLGSRPFAAPQATVVAEHEWRTALRDEYGALRVVDRRKYGQTGISLFSPSTEKEPA